MSELNSNSGPIISVAISPRAKEDLQGLQQALADIAQQDPTVKIEAVPIEGQTIVSGMGELHLESICLRIQQEREIDIAVGETKVLYRETIRGRAEAEGKYIRQTGGSGNYGHCKLRVEPNEPGRATSSLTKLKPP